MYTKKTFNRFKIKNCTVILFILFEFLIIKVKNQLGKFYKIVKIYYFLS